MAALQGLARVVALLMAFGEEGRRVQGDVLAEFVACFDLGTRPQRPAVSRMERQERLGDERLVVVVVIVHRGARLHRRSTGGPAHGYRKRGEMWKGTSNPPTLLAAMAVLFEFNRTET